uniref:Uncharacterized protein n=1 Tax=Biomphalaria glabrata TaxID=6526 RepID=A0A2C9KIE4_BIOGL
MNAIELSSLNEKIIHSDLDGKRPTTQLNSKDNDRIDVPIWQVVHPHFICNLSDGCLSFSIIHPHCSNGYLEFIASKYVSVTLVVKNCYEKVKENNAPFIFWLWGSENKNESEIQRCRFKTSCKVPKMAVTNSFHRKSWLEIGLHFKNDTLVFKLFVTMNSNFIYDKTIPKKKKLISQRIDGTHTIDKNITFKELKNVKNVLAETKLYKIFFRAIKSLTNTDERKNKSNPNFLHSHSRNRRQKKRKHNSLIFLIWTDLRKQTFYNQERKLGAQFNSTESLLSTHQNFDFVQRYFIEWYNAWKISSKQKSNSSLSVNDRLRRKKKLLESDGMLKKTGSSKAVSRRKRGWVNEADDLAILTQGENSRDKDKITEMIASDFASNLDIDKPIVSSYGSSLGNLKNLDTMVNDLKSEREKELSLNDVSETIASKEAHESFHLKRLRSYIKKMEKQLAIAEVKQSQAESDLIANTNDKLAEALARKKADAEDAVKVLSEKLHKLKEDYRIFKASTEVAEKGTKRKLHGLVVIDPMWGDWTPWSKCSADCGEGGFSVRRRECDTLPDVPCDGISFDMRPCNTGLKCEAQWQDWGAWGPCSMTCGKGVRARSRVCMTGDKEISCKGQSSSLEKCTLPLCEEQVVDLQPSDKRSVVSSQGIPKAPLVVVPRSGEAIALQPFVWGVWGQWAACSKNCGEGRQIRVRACVDESKTVLIKVMVNHCGAGSDAQSRTCMGPCLDPAYVAAVGVGAGGAALANYDDAHDGAYIVEQENGEGPRVVVKPKVDENSNKVVLAESAEGAPVVVAASGAAVATSSDEDEENSELSPSTILFIILLILCVILIIIAFCIWFCSRLDDLKLKKTREANQPFYKDSPDVGNDPYSKSATAPVYGLVKPVNKGDNQGAPTPFGMVKPDENVRPALTPSPETPEEPQSQDMSPIQQEKTPKKHSHDAGEVAQSRDVSPARPAKPRKKPQKHSEKRGTFFGGGGLKKRREKDSGHEVKGAGSGRATVLDSDFDQGTDSGDESSDTSSDLDMEMDADEAGGSKGALKSDKKKSRIKSPKGSISGQARKTRDRRGALKGDIYHELGARDRRGAFKDDIYRKLEALGRRGTLKGDPDQTAYQDDNESSSEDSTSSSSGSDDHKPIKKHALKKQAKKKEDILLTKSESVQTSFILCRDAETGDIGGVCEHQAAEVTVKYNKIETCTVEGPVPFKKRTRLVGSDNKAKLWNSDLPYPKESRGKKRLVGARLVYESNMVPFFVDVDPCQGSLHHKSNESEKYPQKINSRLSQVKSLTAVSPLRRHMGTSCQNSNESEKCPQKTSGRLSQVNSSTAVSPLRRHMGTSCQKSNESEKCPQKTSGRLSQVNSSTAVSPLRRHVGMVKVETSQKEDTVGDKEKYLSQNRKQIEHVYLDNKLKTLPNKQAEVNQCNQEASKLSSLTVVETGGANSCTECFHGENGQHAECVSVTEKLRFFSPLTSPLSSQLYLTLCSEDSGLEKGISQPSSSKEKGHRKDSNVQNVMTDQVFRVAKQFSTELQDKEKSSKFKSPQTSQHGREVFLKAAHPYQTTGEEEEEQQSKRAQTPELFRPSTDTFSLIHQAQSDLGQVLSLSDPEKFSFVLQDTIKPQTETRSKQQSQLYTTLRLLKETDSDAFFSSIQDSHELTDYRDPLEENKVETYSEEKDHNLHNETDIRNLSYQQKKESVLKLLKTAPKFQQPPSGALASTQTDSGTISLISLSGDVGSSTIDDILNSNASTGKFIEPQETSSWTTGMNQTELMKTEASEENELPTDPSVDANANKNIDLNPVVKELEKKQFKLLKTICMGESRLKIYGKGQFCCCNPMCVHNKSCSAPIYQSICSAYRDTSEPFCPNTSQECTCGEIIRSDNCLSHACSDQLKCLHLKQDPSTVANAYAGHQQERSFSPLGRRSFSKDKLQKCVRFSKSTIMDSSNSDSCQDIFQSSSSSTSTRGVPAKADENQLKKMLNIQIQKFLETTKWASTKDVSDIHIDWARTQKNKKRGCKTSSQYSARLCCDLSDPGKRGLSSQHSFTMKPDPYTTFPSQPCLYTHLYHPEKIGKMLSNSLEKQAECHPSYALNDQKSHLPLQFESKTSAWTDSLLNSEVNYKSFTPTDQQLPGNSEGVPRTGVSQYQHFHSNTSMFDHTKQSGFPQVSTDCLASQKSTTDTLKSNWSCEMLQHPYLSSPRARNDDQLKMSPKKHGGHCKSPSARSSQPSSARYLDTLGRCDVLSLAHKRNYESRPNVSVAGQSTVRFLVDASDDEGDSFVTATDDSILVPLSDPTTESFRSMSSEHPSFIASASEEDERNESFFTMETLPENNSLMFSPIQCSPRCIPGRKKEIGKPWSSRIKFSREGKSLSPRAHISCARDRPAYNEQAFSFKRRELCEQGEKRLGEGKNRLGLQKTLLHSTDALHRGPCQETLKNRSVSDGHSDKRLKELLSSRLSKISFSDTSLDTSQTNSHVNSITGKCSSYTSLNQKQKCDKLQQRPSSFSNLEFNGDEKYPKYERPALNRKSTVEYYVEKPHLHMASTNQRKYKRSPLMDTSKMSSHELADEFKSHESQRRYSDDSRMKNKQSPRRSSHEYTSCPRNAKLAECKTDQSYRSLDEPKYQKRSSEKLKSPRRPSDKCETHRNKHNIHTQLSDEHHQKRYSNNPSKDTYNRRSTEMCQTGRKTEDRECTTDMIPVNSSNELGLIPKQAYLQSKKELHSFRKYSLELDPQETNLKSKKDSKIQKRLSRETSPSNPWVSHDSPQRKSPENYKAVGSAPSLGMSHYSSLPRRLSINFKNEKSILHKYTSDQCEKGKTSLKALEESNEETFIDKFISDHLQQAQTSLGRYNDNYTSLDKSTSDESEQVKTTFVTSDKCSDDQINLDKSASEESKKTKKSMRLEESNDKQASLNRRLSDEHKSNESYLQKRHSDESLQTLCKSLRDSPTTNRSSDDSKINLYSHRKKVGQWEPDQLTHNKQTPLNKRHSDVQKSKESYLQKRHSDESLQTLCKSIYDSPTRKYKSLHNRSSDDSDINLFLHRKKVGERQPDQSTIHKMPSCEFESSLHKMPTDNCKPDKISSQKISDDCRDKKCLGRSHSDHFPNLKISEQKFSSFALKSNKTNSHRISKDACKPSSSFHSISIDNLNQDKISKNVTKPAKSFKHRQQEKFHAQTTSVHGKSSNFLRSNPEAVTHQVDHLSLKNKLLLEDSEQSDTTYSEVRTFSEQMTKEDSRSFKSVTSFDSLFDKIGRDQSQNKREDLTGEGSMVSSSMQHSGNLQPVVHTNSIASSAPHFVLSQRTRKYFAMPESLTDKSGAEDEHLNFGEEESTSTQFYDSVHLTRFRYSAGSPEALRRNPNYKPSVMFEETDLDGYLLAGHCVSDIDLLISEHETSGSVVDTGYHLSQSSNSNAIQTLDENICTESLSIGSQSMQTVNIVIHTFNSNKPDVSSKGPEEKQTSPASIIYHSVISDQTNFETLADTSTSKASNIAHVQNPPNDYLLDDNEEFFSLSCSTFKPGPCPNSVPGPCPNSLPGPCPTSLPGTNNQLNDTSKRTKGMHRNSDTRSSSEADTLFFSPTVTAKISPTPEKHLSAGDQRKESMQEQECQLQPDQLVKDSNQMSANHLILDRNIKYGVSSQDTPLDLQSDEHNNQPVSSLQETMSALDQKACIQRKDIPVQIQPLDLSTRSSLHQSTACVNPYTQSVHQLPQAKVSITTRVEHWKPLHLKKTTKSKHKKVCPSSGFYRHTKEQSPEVFIDNCQDKSCQATISQQVQNQGIIPKEDLSQSIQLQQDPSQNIHPQQDPSQNIHPQQDPSQNIHQQQDPSQNIHIQKEQISGIIPPLDLSQDSFSQSEEKVQIEKKIAENLLLELGADKLLMDIQTENVRVLIDDIEYDEDNTSKPSHSKNPFYWNKKELFSEDLLGDDSDWIQSAAENTLSDVSSDIFEKSNEMLRLAVRRTNAHVAYEMPHLLQSNSIEEVILNEAEEEECSTSSDTSDCTQPPCVWDQDDISVPKMTLQQEAHLKPLGEPSKACLCPPKQFEKYEVQYKSTLLYEHSPSKDEACCINYIQPKSVNILAHPLCDFNVGVNVELSPQHPKPKGNAQKRGCGKDPLGQEELNYFEPDKLTNLIHSKRKWGVRLANVSPQSNQHSPISFQEASLIREICVSDRETQATSLIRERCVSDRETQATSLIREICVSDRETQADLSCSSQPMKTLETDHSIYRSSVLNEAEPEEFTASLVYRSQSSDQSIRHSTQCTCSADYFTQGLVNNSQQGRYVSPVRDVCKPSLKKIQDSFVTSSHYKVTAKLEKKTERLAHAPPSAAEVGINVIRQGQRLTQNSLHAVEFGGYGINTSPSSDRQDRPQRKGSFSREKTKNAHVLANTQWDHQPGTLTSFSSPEALKHQMQQQFPDVARHRRSRSQSRKQKFNCN